MSVSISPAGSGPAVGAHSIISSTGVRTYTVHVAFDGTMTCNCPDFVYRHADKHPTYLSVRGDMCKHCAGVIAGREGQPYPAKPAAWYDLAPEPETQTCSLCDGKGVFHDDLDFVKPHKCSACKGLGRVPVYTRTPSVGIRGNSALEVVR
jgi:hypothetical protein